MLFRKQNLFLFFSLVVSSGLGSWVPLWEHNGHNVTALDVWYVMIFFMLSSLISVLSIALYKDRVKQKQWVYINIVLNILLMGLLYFCLQNLPGGLLNAKKGIGLVVPFLNTALLLASLWGIIKDQKLVKSADRIR